MAIRRTIRGVVAAGWCLLLAACVLDTEDLVRAELKDWLYLARTRHFVSRATCTVAVFELASGDIRSTGGPRRVTDFVEAERLIKDGRAVVFDMPGLTPSEVSQGMMARDLSSGLGILSSGVGPSLSCMEDKTIARGFYAVLTSDAAITIYNPASNALVLVYRPEGLALFMRGNV